jgi:DHA3 family macrolide efflux protein-like MFS transporter
MSETGAEQVSQQADWRPPFFLIWTGQAFSLMGSSLVQFALVWWLTQTTGSATVLATATLAAILPGVFLGPFAGALVDRWNRRIVMMVADGCIALATLGLAYLYMMGVMQIWHVYVIMAIRAIGGGFHWPAMQASTSLMVPKAHLSRVAGLNQTIQGALNIISPPLGAVLLGILPLHGIMAIDIATAMLAIVPLFFVYIPQPQRSAAALAEGGHTSLWGDVHEGLRYIWNWPGVMAILVMATVINFLVNPAFTLMPILVTKHFGGQALQLAWIESAWGIGVVAGGLTLSVWGGFHRRILTTLVGLIGMGIGTLVIGLSPAAAFGLALGGMILAGFMNPITNGPVFAVIQSVVAPEMQGRVFTVIGSITSAMSPLGMAIAGPVADAFGVQTWFVVGGIVCALMGMSAFFMPAVVHLEDRPAGQSVVMDQAPAAGGVYLDVAGK